MSLEDHEDYVQAIAFLLRKVRESTRERTIADVIDLIRSERVTHPSQEIAMPSEELVEMIQALSQPST